MVTRICLFAVVCSLGAYCVSSYLTDSQPDHTPSIDLETKHLVVESETQKKLLQPAFNRTVDNNGLKVLQAVEPKPIVDAELVMSDSLANLHLEEFNEYLRGERASEHTTLAFYTNSRWYEFYERVGYPSEDIHQLIAFRNQYLADISQSGKEYYWHRWSNAPHRALAKTLAYTVLPRLGNGEDKELTLRSSISDVASEYGITDELVERVAKKYLLSAMGTIEVAALFNSPADPQVIATKVDSGFVEFLKEQAGYTKKKAVIDENMSDIYSSSSN
ncbi:hypothetical protein L1D14_04140 [Vibrio tubiashii]|uniref:hypothetical protein n=1 Tax=Vibrio tubiashii TaxID=29498 RepID=UPI001EFD682C|nr:hypothetical protein [Vibrio tubiashii]MCG9575421.1 hypothetical protein [Vibrio tubiashii]